MATNNHAYKSYSMEYGTFIGLSWGVLFLCYVEGISYGNNLLVLLCLLFCAISFFLPFLLALRLNRKLLTIDENLSYIQGLLFSFSMFMYACLMNGFIVFAYFQFLDDGTLFEQLHNMIKMPELKAAYQQMGMDEQYSQMIAILKDVNQMSTFEKTLGIFNNNFVFGSIMSFVVAFFASYNLKKLNK